MRLSDSHEKFLLQEHSQLREEIAWDMKQIAETERYAIIVSGAIWAWLATQEWNLSLIVAILIPALATKLLQYKRKSLGNAINLVAKYIYKIEDVFQAKDQAGEVLGWEHSEKISPFRSWSRTFWNLLFWGNILIAIVYIVAQLIQVKVIRL